MSTGTFTASSRSIENTSTNLQSGSTRTGAEKDEIKTLETPANMIQAFFSFYKSFTNTIFYIRFLNQSLRHIILKINITTLIPLVIHPTLYSPYQPLYPSDKAPERSLEKN